MTPKQHLIDCFRALCDRTPGGVDAVAAEIDASVDGLKQVLAGTKLPKGDARGIGPSIQKKLEAKYPGWSQLDPRAQSSPWPLRRWTPQQWDEVDPYDRAVMEDAAMQKLRELQLERAGQANGTSGKRKPAPKG